MMVCPFPKAPEELPVLAMIPGKNSFQVTRYLNVDLQILYLLLEDGFCRSRFNSKYQFLKNERADSYLTGMPQIPAILMSNLTEFDGPIAYAAVSEQAAVPPALRPIRSPGHVNVNWVEHLESFQALITWIETGEISSVSDGTRIVPVRETGTILKNNMLENSVTK